MLQSSQKQSPYRYTGAPMQLCIRISTPSHWQRHVLNGAPDPAAAALIVTSATTSDMWKHCRVEPCFELYVLRSTRDTSDQKHGSQMLEVMRCGQGGTCAGSARVVDKRTRGEDPPSGTASMPPPACTTCAPKRRGMPGHTQRGLRGGMGWEWMCCVRPWYVGMRALVYVYAKVRHISKLAESLVYK